MMDALHQITLAGGGAVSVLATSILLLVRQVITLSNRIVVLEATIETLSRMMGLPVPPLMPNRRKDDPLAAAKTDAAPRA